MLNIVSSVMEESVIEDVVSSCVFMRRKKRRQNRRKKRLVSNGNDLKNSLKSSRGGESSMTCDHLLTLSEIQNNALQSNEENMLEKLYRSCSNCEECDTNSPLIERKRSQRRTSWQNHRSLSPRKTVLRPYTSVSAPSNTTQYIMDDYYEGLTNNFSTQQSETEDNNNNNDMKSLDSQLRTLAIWERVQLFTS
ncbi:uncharacterized protein LOC141901570 [Tubulanus polymorphus]|uniref:uncharacterized protein LOC141901570 n=1 Tax=Tubulanus polymorphus TaxID=672921 RepID=UPI003DA3A6F2